MNILLFVALLVGSAEFSREEAECVIAFPVTCGDVYERYVNEQAISALRGIFAKNSTKVSILNTCSHDAYFTSKWPAVLEKLRQHPVCSLSYGNYDFCHIYPTHYRYSTSTVSGDCLSIGQSEKDQTRISSTSESTLTLIQILKMNNWKSVGIAYDSDHEFILRKLTPILIKERLMINKMTNIGDHSTRSVHLTKFFTNLDKSLKVLLIYAHFGSKEVRELLESVEDAWQDHKQVPIIWIESTHTYDIHLGKELDKMKLTNFFILSMIPLWGITHQYYVKEYKRMFASSIQYNRKQHNLTEVNRLPSFLDAFYLFKSLNIRNKSSIKEVVLSLSTMKRSGFMKVHDSVEIKVVFSLLHYNYQRKLFENILKFDTPTKMSLKNKTALPDEIFFQSEIPEWKYYKEINIRNLGSPTEEVTITLNTILLATLFLYVFAKKTMFFEKKVSLQALLLENDGFNFDNFTENYSFSKKNPQKSYQTAHKFFATYKNRLTVLKSLRNKGEKLKERSVSLISKMSLLHHENISTLVGVYKSPTTIEYSMVWEFCRFGTLMDVIPDEKIKLSWEYKVYLFLDIIRGLAYIHSSSIQCHGNLKSSNCVIDSNWVLKLTDYGRNLVTAAEGNEIADRPEKMLWYAPECLRDHNLLIHGSQESDIYSFSIILQEIITRSKPFSMLAIREEEILENLKSTLPTTRPILLRCAAPKETIAIMKRCWLENPRMRPSLESIRKAISFTIKGKKKNVFDKMCELMQDHSEKLEEIVNERSKDLEKEIEKTRHLLAKMLPLPVCEQLKKNKGYIVEEFAEVTIYFSDICDFNEISSDFTPLEVVSLLNEIYTLFDSIIKKFDAYKIETIADSYIVASGLPIRNAGKHVSEIADLAINLLNEGSKIIVKNRPGSFLKLRMGMHTGPCVAGVVGITMPRYCLFGDTVNMASRMDSTGKELRIHCSQASYNRLVKIGGYKFIKRKKIKIKGKGTQQTYWLIGKEDLDTPMVCTDFNDDSDLENTE